MTHRQFVLWGRWLEEQWDRPSRGDYYLMQVACQVARVLAKHPDKIKLEHFQLRFSDPASDTAPSARNTAAAEQHRKNQMAWSKSKWLGAMRGTIEHRTISKAEAIERGFLEADPHYTVDATG